MARAYTMRRRAELLEETRSRIVAATVALHEEVGPACTTVAAIAERAGVSRPTVYKQFPDDRALFAACSASWRGEHPLPELDGDLDEALLALYSYFAENERMLRHVDRDARLLPAVASVYDQTLETLRRAADEHAARIEPGSPSVRAVARLAFGLGTWHRLSGAELDAAEAAALMARLVRSESG